MPVCRALLEEDNGPLVTTGLVVAEAAYLIRRQVGSDGEVALYTSIIDGALGVEPLVAGDWHRVRELVDRYRNLALAGTDASLIAVAERLRADRVATLDRRHFSVVRPNHVACFEFLPT
jgi:predicted nucleic acid-binding protein